MNRRNFLKGCLAAAAAPAFIKSESLMGLYVPKPQPISSPEIVNRIRQEVSDMMYANAIICESTCYDANSSEYQEQLLKIHHQHL